MARPTVLIALDGTKLSEHSFMLLPLMVQIGVQQVVLVRAAAGGRRLSKSEDGDDVQAYLDTCAQRLQPFDIEIRTEARIGDPAREILRAAGHLPAARVTGRPPATSSRANA